jgi:hypothetical protein
MVLWTWLVDWDWRCCGRIMRIAAGNCADGATYADSVYAALMVIENGIGIVNS